MESIRTSAPVIESITQFEWRNLTIRVWRTENEVYEHYETIYKIHLINELPSDAIASKVGIIKVLSKLPNVSAIEVKDTKSGNGVVYYVEWP